nr:uncharacterized protein LOC113708496 isoform X2 [Coffea arabica]XP_027088420.1 uncharacterized protein LOC113709766 isoform X2 [Coffea arabica]
MVNVFLIHCWTIGPSSVSMCLLFLSFFGALEHKPNQHCQASSPQLLSKFNHSSSSIALSSFSSGRWIASSKMDLARSVSPKIFPIWHSCSTHINSQPSTKSLQKKISPEELT